MAGKAEQTILRIVLLGRTGVGKGSAGNTILGEDVFEEGCTLQTQICKRHEKEINGRQIVVMDTPGIKLDSRKELLADIASCLVECTPGPHVFIVVVGVARHTRKNQETVEKLLECLSEEFFSRMVLLFTHGDDLEENTTIVEFINYIDEGTKSGGRTLKGLAEKCGNRVHVIDNKHWNQNSKVPAVLDGLKNLNVSDQILQDITSKMEASQKDKTPWFNTLTDQADSEEQEMVEYRSNSFQLTQLMKSVKTILRNTNAQPYRNKALEEFGEAIQEEVNSIVEEMENDRDRREMMKIRRRAIERVITRRQRQLAGVAIGILLGAVFGAAVGVAAPVVFVAGLIRAVWRMLTPQISEAGNPAVENEGVGTNVVGAIGVWAVVLSSGLKALPFFPVCGAGFGFMCGYHMTKTSDNPNQTMVKVFQALQKKSLDVLKTCWNLE